MRTIRKNLNIFIGLITILQICSCTEDRTIDVAQTETTGQAMFWTASDLGVGSISVSCDGTTRTFNSYYNTGVPSCGASGVANFTLNPGVYSFSASGGGLSWSGSITVSSGGCSKLELTGTGIGNNLNLNGN